MISMELCNYVCEIEHATVALLGLIGEEVLKVGCTSNTSNSS